MNDPQTLLRGLGTLDDLLHRGPFNGRVAQKLIEKLESEHGLVPRLAYLKRLLHLRDAKTL
jgi:hypothetical protein